METPFQKTNKDNSEVNNGKLYNLKKSFYSSMFFDEFVKRDFVTNKGLLLEDRKKVWAFNAGDTFTGNPKWLFIYVNKYRKDIDAYWLCDNVETVDYVRSLGYKAYAFNAGGGIEVKNRAGVFVTEQVKEIIPEGMENTILLNLYHGVGCKTIERKVDSGFLVERLYKKFIKNSNYYFNNMLFLVTSPLMEKHFMSQVGVDEEHIIRAGYPRCVYQKYYNKISTFNHNIIENKKRDKNTKVVAYAPTYRDNAGVDLMNSAIPNMAALEKKLKENNLLFILKMHPFVVEDINYINIKKKYENSPYFLFWDNNHDFYEILDKIDIAVVDYSSIFYDFLAAGVKHYVRYFFDYDNPDNLRDFAFDCKEMTCGKICNNFDEFLNVFDDYSSTDSEEEERKRIYDLFWQYSDKDTFEKIIETTLNFVPKNADAPTLYSFDIFDTIISRKGLHPHSIFYKVKEMLQKSNLGFNENFVKNFVKIRIRCEQNAREYYDKTLYVRKSNEREITLDEIVARMAALYSFTQEQIDFVKNAEMQAEYDDCIPIESEISYIESLIDKGEDVVLISDMYLPKELIIKMLNKVSNKIAKLPLFLSSEYKVQKTTCRLYFEVYKSFDFYKYGKWIHHGDNALADRRMPARLGIESVFHIPPKLSKYELRLARTVGTYDAFLVAANMARFRANNKNSTDYFCYAYASLMFVPYIIWAISDAEKRGIDTLYFISRDGHHLKRIADKVIEKTGSKIKTKYIYGSRKVWRIPSFINEFDESFFLPFGNVAAATNFKSLLKALSIDYKTFIKIFPNLSYLKKMKSFSKKTRNTIISILSNSEEYKQYLLEYAAKKREIIDKYFLQEMDFSEKFAFVEYWGRGYTQTCHTRLLQNVVGKEIDVPYYYMRSIYPTIGHDIRYNFTDSNTSLIFVEALFANIDYKSIEKYEIDENGKVVPVKKPADCDMNLLNSLNIRLVQFCEDFLDLGLDNPISLGRDLLKYALDYFKNNQSDEVILNTVAGLIDSVGLFGDKREFAPALTKEIVDKIVNKDVTMMDVTSSIEMSLARSDKEVQDYYEYLTVTKPAEEKELKRGNKTKYSAKAVDFNNKLKLLNFKNLRKNNESSYVKYAKSDILNKAVFFGENAENNELYLPIIKKMGNQGVEIETLPYNDIYSAEQLKIIAQAKYLFCDRETEFFAIMKFRPETKFVRLYKETFPIDKFGVQDIEYGKRSDFRLKSKIFNANCTLIPCAGKGLVSLFEKSFKNTQGIVKPIGIPVCDLYFDDEFKALAVSKMKNINTQNKKVILYLPKTSESKQSPFDFIHIDTLKDKLCDEYILAVKDINNSFTVCAYADRHDGFSFLLDESISVREAIIASDIVIGDFSSEIIEATIADKPIIFTGVYDSLKCITPSADIAKKSGALVANDTYELCRQILSVDKFDTGVYDKFKKKYLNGCNGKSTENVLSLLN